MARDLLPRPQASRSATISSTSAVSMARRISDRGSRSVTTLSTLTRSWS